MKLLRYLTFPIIVLTLALMIRSSSYAYSNWTYETNGYKWVFSNRYNDSAIPKILVDSNNKVWLCCDSPNSFYCQYYVNNSYWSANTYQCNNYNSDYNVYVCTNPYWGLGSIIDMVSWSGEFVNFSPNSYDENIQLKAWQYVDYQLFSGALGCLTHWQVSLDMLSVVDHVDMTVTNNTTGVTTYVGSVPSWYNFNPGAYGSPGDNISVSATPFDSSGNWGTTKVFSMKIRTSIADAVTNWFNSGSSLVSTSNEFNVNVIGIKESNTYDTTIKPNANTPVPSTGTNVTTNYSPVITTNSNNTTVSDITNYIDESQTVTNNYNETVNNVYKTTTFDFDFNFDNAEGSVNDGINFLKGVPKAFNMVGQLFVYLFPFLDPKISFIICSAFGIVIAFGLVVLFVKFLGIIL